MALFARAIVERFKDKIAEVLIVQARAIVLINKTKRSMKIMMVCAKFPNARVYLFRF